jgi:hypothetical protein
LRLRRGDRSWRMCISPPLLLLGGLNPGSARAGRPWLGIVAFVVAVSIAGGALVSMARLPAGTGQTTSLQSTTQAQDIVVEDPLPELPGLPTLYHEACAGSLTPFVPPTVCNSTTSTVGVPQVFNMSKATGSSADVSLTFYDQFFAFQLAQNSTVQFTFRAVEPGSQPGSVYVYYGGDSSVNFTDLQGDVLSGSLQQIADSGTPMPGGGLFPTDRFSGQIAARPGVYIFDLQYSPGGGGAAYFLVRDATALQNGITVRVGPPQISFVSFNGSACGGGPGETGPGEEEFPVTVASNTTTNVDLSSPDVPFGVWVHFVPSELEGVGPRGAHATMLVAGDVEPSGGNPNNASLFVDAFNPAGGPTGESVVALDAAFGFTNVLRTVGPVGWLANPAYPGVLFSSLGSTENQTAFSSVAEGNQTNYAVLTNVYDPAITGGTQTASSLSVKITGVGLVQNGSEAALPMWIAVKPVGASFVMTADEPYELQICVSISDSPPLGEFTIALNEIVNGQLFTGELGVEIMP